MSATPTAVLGAAARSTAGTAATQPAAQGTAQASSNAGSSGAESAAAGDGLAATLEALRKQADGQSAVINRLTKELKELRGRVEPQPREEEEGAGQEGEGQKRPYKSPYMRQLQELKEFKSQVEQERAALLRDSVAQNILFGLTIKGVDSKLAGIVAESLLGRLGNRVANTKDALGRIALEVRGEAEGEEAVSLEKWLEAFMASDEGKALMPASPNPSLKGVPIRRSGAGEGKIRITKDDMRAGRFDPEAMAAGKVVVIE